jgi:hypothetical protein
MNTDIKIIYHKIEPVNIKVFDNVALIHYYYREIYKDEDGKEKFYNAKFTDVLLKGKDHWMLIGGHGGKI